MSRFETPDVGSPEEVEVWLSHTVPPQPQHARLSSGPRKAWNFNQNQRAPHDGRRSTSATILVELHFGMQVRPGAYLYRAVSRIFAVMLLRRRRPCRWLFGLQLRTMTARAPGPRWRWRIGIEATPRAQPDEHLRPTSFQPLLQPHRIVSSVEDEKRRVIAFGQSAE